MRFESEFASSCGSESSLWKGEKSMRSRRGSFSIIAILALGVLLFQAGCAAAPLQQTEETQPSQNDATAATITVTGSGEISVSPDEAVLVLGVETEASEASAALTQNDEEMQAVIDALVKAGVAEKDIQTELFSLQPRYSQPQQGSVQEVIGYTATHLVSVLVSDVGTVGAVVDAASQAGANRINSIQFDVGNPGQQLDQARSAAWDDAQQKAEQLAGLAGAKLGAVESISEGSAAPGIVEAAALGLGGGGAPIQPGQLTFSVQLEVKWALQ
jgi:uncharacterized protein YggE